MRFIPFALLLLHCITPAAWAHDVRMHFIPDQHAALVASRNAQHMVEFARTELNLDLDFSDQSIEKIERVSSELRTDLHREHAALRDVDNLVQMLGSYLGEVYRRNHGGEWGYASPRGKPMMALKTDADDSLLWPTERIRQRLKSGTNNNVWAYYQSRVALANN